MAVMKCKMCGGDLEIAEGSNIAICEYCGTKQTVPTLDNERKTSLFGRAGRLLRACEFDKASVVFGDIVSEFPEEAEAYWGLLLCKYGVEYVDDPATGKKIPTCHRLSFESVMEDSDFEQACENADSVARGVYREEAKFLENLRKNVIEVSSKEEPYDVFICYKETDLKGDRTIDSVMAQDIYDALREKGLRVFFARITLEDKLGMEYEPYIFAALNSAKVMLAIGTDYEYFNAVWVKNEWSRFLKLIANGEKKVLIPCYKGIDAYDMPAEFKNLQAQDMGKLGFMQDLVRGVCKIVGRNEQKTAAGNAAVSAKANIEPLLRRAFMFLEDGDFASADDYCEKVLDINPECAEAYLGKLMAEYKVNKKEKLAELDEHFNKNGYYLKAVHFGDGKLKANFDEYTKAIEKRIEDKEKDRIYEEAKALIKSKNFDELYKTIDNLKSIAGWKDSEALIIECENSIKEHERNVEILKEEKKRKKAKNKKIAAIVTPLMIAAAAALFVVFEYVIPAKKYEEALAFVDSNKFAEAYAVFEEIADYKDVPEQVAIAKTKEITNFIKSGNIERAKELVENEEEIYPLMYSIAEEYQKEQEFDKAYNLFYYLFVDGGKYKDSNKKAIAVLEEKGDYYMDKQDYKTAFESYFEIKSISSSSEYTENIKVAGNLYANELMAAEKYQEAVDVILKYANRAKKYENSDEMLDTAFYVISQQNYKDGDYISAVKNYERVRNYDAKAEFYIESLYNAGNEYKNNREYTVAVSCFEKIPKYKDSKELVNEAKYLYIKTNKNSKDRHTYEYLKELKALGYKDTAKIFKELYKLSLTGYFHDKNDKKITSISRINDYLGATFTLVGGEPGKKYTLTHCNVWPSGSVSWSDWNWNGEFAGSTFGVEWSDGFDINYKGTLTIKVYVKGTGEFVGSISIKVTS